MEGIREIVLKARQEGMSSYILALFTVDFLLRPHSVSICISHRKDATDLLFKKVKYYLRCYFANLSEKTGVPLDKLEKQFLKSDNKSLLENAENSASFYIGTAGAKVGGRGGSARNILYSECLDGNQEVICEHGSSKKIKDITSTDKILLSNGLYRSPVGVKELESDKDLVRITSFGNVNHPIISTKDHKILCTKADPWKNKEIKKSGRYFRFAKPTWVQAREIKPGDFIAHPMKAVHGDIKELEFNGNKVNRGFEFGELIGWYLAEGSISNNRIDLGIHINEKEYLEKLLKTLKLNYSVYQRSYENNSATISIFSSELATYIKQFFGTARNKTINNKVWGWSSHFCKGLLKGLFLGDATFLKDKVVYTTVCKSLALQVRNLMAGLWLGFPALQEEDSRVGGENHFGQRIVGKHKTYSLIVTSASRQRLFKHCFTEEINLDKCKNISLRETPHKWNRKWKYGSGYLWVEVKSAEGFKGSGKVYDIVLDSDPHSFSTIGGIVHNCAFYQDTELITAQEIVLGTSQQVPQGRGMIFIESTANGEGNYYHEEWERASLPLDGEGNRSSIYMPRFFGWEEFYTEKWVNEKKKEFPTEKMWKQEYPKTAEEAFVTSGQPYFDNQLLEAMRRSAPEPIRQGKLAPDGTMDLFEENAPFKVYRELKPGEQIVIFADPADSHDFCAAVACSKKNYDFPLVFNDVLTSSQFGYELHAFCKYVFTATNMWPKLAIERNTGQATIYVLKTLNYPDLFRMVDFASQSGVQEKGQIGWVTTGFMKGGELQGTRRKMLDDLALAVKQGQITIYDKEQIKQMKSFQIVKGRAQAKANKHDDLVMSGAGAWQIHMVTPSVDWGDWDDEEFKKEKDKWRFR